MQLAAKASLGVHVTLYRLTNGRIGGKFIAASRFSCSRPPVGGPASGGPDRWPTSARRRPLVRVRLPTALLHLPVILAWYHNLARPARPRSRSDPSILPSAPRPPIPPSAASCSRAFAGGQGLRRLRAKDQPLQIPLVVLTPSTAEHDLTAAGWSASRNRHTNDAQPPQARLVSPTKSGPPVSLKGAVVDLARKRRKAWLLSSCRKWLWSAGHMSRWAVR